MSRALLALAFLALAFLAGCPGSEVTTTTLTDTGCAFLNEAGQVEVDFQTCLSSSCDTLVSATCTAELVDGVLVVHAEAVIDSEGDECTDDCGFVSATCEAPLIEDPETVTLSYAGVMKPLDEACDGF